MRTNNNPPDYDFLCKMLLVGDSGSGKSSILLRFSDDVFNEQWVPTIGIKCFI